MFWKPGSNKPLGGGRGDSSDQVLSAIPLLETDEKVTLSVVYNAKRHLSFQQQRRELPVYSHSKEFLWAVQISRVVIVIGETGTGKSTQLPQYLKEAGWCSDGRDIIVCVPMRIAALTLASRVSEELQTPLGEEVGFCTSDETCGSSGCVIRYVTDGVLLRMIQADPLLLKTSVVILDDCHQRRKETDILLGLIKMIHKKRPYLRLIISSATVDTEIFVNFFHSRWMTLDQVPSMTTTAKEKESHLKKPIRPSRWDTSPLDQKQGSLPTQRDTAGLKDVSLVRISGRPYPIEIKYLKTPCSDYIKAAFEAVLHIHRTEKDIGSILVFLCGKTDIEDVTSYVNSPLVDMLSDDCSRFYDRRLGPIEVAPLYGALPADQQLAALRRPKPGSRKVIVATNIAESSVTIDRVSFVVDCGFVKLSCIDPNYGVEFLSVVPTSIASATQRAGRAGRTAPGVCYRLYPESVIQTAMSEFSVPELLRTNLSQTVLYLLSLGIENFVSHVEFPTPVSSESLIAALSELHALEAVDEFGRLTHPLGERMAELPLDPKLSRFVLLSAEERFGCSYEAIIIAAMATCGSPWVTPPAKSRMKQGLLEACMRSLGVSEGDFVTLYNVYKQSEFYRNEDSNWDSRHMISTKSLKRVEKVKKQLEKYFDLWGIEKVSIGQDLSRLCKAICAGFFLNAAQRQRDGTYKLCRQQSGTQASHIPPLAIHPLSLANPKQPLFLVFHEAIAVAGIPGVSGRQSVINKTPNNHITHMLGVTPIEPQWLSEVAPHYFKLNLGHHAEL